VNFAKDSFLRCYLEGWALWLGGNAFIGWVEYFRAKFARQPAPRPFGFIESLSEPVFFIANALLVVLFAAVLVGHRRPTGKTE
jgi:hypothetical protein